ncbi:anthranilate phosphoribosyltransferase [Natronorubrum daqingense]|uniref:Anthranilate phosphoribosyltransferase n=1 Tax=Natronorubrum daqingense TaxID=588898 RepID=A0A1N7CX85_9EURY|nr:anthranilate phosphoribosyltransferase [Natronorubrum daqingense]APX97104.1 anthranilate phosphoribosyltransferase [Natronorubrum daqingense]SIR68193.1 anthranilate phosphoribosyltransferase [Natronorubrum daqingense]
MAQTSQTFGEWPLKRLMTEVVGSGPKSADDMTRAQAREAFQRILAGEPDETTLGAFFLANRWKRNNPEELAGYTDVMREESVLTAEPDANPVDCGANYDGKHTSAVLGVGAGLVAAAAGTPIVVHSGDRVPTQKATAYKHVLDELGVRTQLEPAESAEMVDETGFGFYYQPSFNPGVHDLYARRDQMGVRTFVNTIETVANPANADVHLGSFYHLAFAKKMTDLIEESAELEYSRAIFFQGMEGYDDIRPGYTKVAEWDHGEELEDYEIETGEYGMEMENDDLAVDDVTTDSASITEDVLSGERDDHFADAVALNGALRMHAREDVASLEDGIDEARAVIDDGSAKAVLEALRAF